MQEMMSTTDKTFLDDGDEVTTSRINCIVGEAERLGDDLQETRTRTVAVTQTTLHAVAPHAPEFAAFIIVLSMMDALRARFSFLQFIKKGTHYFARLEEVSPKVLRQSLDGLEKDAPSVVEMFRGELAEVGLAGDFGGEGGI